MTMKSHGVEVQSIKSTITSTWKEKYLAANLTGKNKIRDAIQKAYKAMGLTAEDANKIIDGWKKKTKTATSGLLPTKTSTAVTTMTTKTAKAPDNYTDTIGRYGKGNIDLNNRKVVHNKDGSISTVKSITVTIDDEYWLIPTVVNGKIVSEQEAIDYALDHNQYLGKFKTLKEANAYAEKLSERMDWYYNK